MTFFFSLSIVSRESKSKVGQGNLINPCRDRFSTVQSILQVLMFVVSDSIRHSLKGGDPAAPSDTATLLRLHPSHWSTLDGCLLAVNSPALGTPNSHGVTGGVYKTRERIHPDILIRDY